jgi:hypothetical protein
MSVLFGADLPGRLVGRGRRGERSGWMRSGWAGFGWAGFGWAGSGGTGLGRVRSGRGSGSARWGVPAAAALLALAGCGSGPGPATTLGGVTTGASSGTSSGGPIPVGSPSRAGGTGTPTATTGGGASGSGGGHGGGGGHTGGGGGSNGSSPPFAVTVQLDRIMPATPDACPVTFTASGTLTSTAPGDAQYRIQLILNDASEVDSDPITAHFAKAGSQPLSYPIRVPLAPAYNLKVQLELLGQASGPALVGPIPYHTVCNSTGQLDHHDYEPCGQASSLVYKVLQPIGPQRQLLYAKFVDEAHPEQYSSGSYAYDFPAGNLLFHDYTISKTLQPGQVIDVTVYMPSGATIGPDKLMCT